MERQLNGIRRKPLGFRPLHSFRLSTWFALVAILALAMMIRPWITTRVNVRVVPYSAFATLPHISANARIITSYVPDFDSGLYTVRKTLHYDHVEKSVNARLLYPALALAAFVGWKAAWQIIERRRTRAQAGAP